MNFFTKIIEFLQDSSGKLSSARLAMFLIVLTFTSDYVAHIIRADGAFDPSLSIIGLVTAIIGIKVIQQKNET